MKILMIEDEKFFAEPMAQILRKKNYDVDLSFDGISGLDEALTGVYDVILLDIMLPGMDGISVLKEIRSEGIATPVILLTALGEVEDRVKGLDAGADDYLPKPFRSEELLARIRAMLRRRGELAPGGILRFADLEYDPNSLIMSAHDKSLDLTAKEGRLLEYLMLSKGTALSSESIIEKIWGWDSDAEDNHVQVYISFLRKKLDSLDTCVRIKTIRNVGYLLAESSEE